MRIAMLLEAVYPPDIRVQKEVGTLVDAGHDVFVLSYSEEDLPDHEVVDGAEVIRRPIQHTHDEVRGWIAGLQYLLTYVHKGWTTETRNLIKAEDIDVLHAHDLPVVKTALKLGQEYDIPVVADLHENWPEAKRLYRKGEFWEPIRSNPKLLLERVLKSTRRLKQFERDSVRHADRVIAIVEEGKSHYVEDCGADPHAVHVVSNVVDLDYFDNAEIRPIGYEEDFVISYIGTMSGVHRGLHTVIRALPEIADRVSSARLLLVGPESTYSRKLEELAAEVGVSDRVTFTGRVPFDQVPSHISASDVCLVPHQRNPHTETTVPHKLFQYMALEKPVIVTDVKPVARVIRTANAGVVVPPEDSEAMAEAVTGLANNQQQRVEYGKNGRNAVENQYNWTIEGQKLLRLYEELAQPK